MVQDILLRWSTMELSMEICRYLIMPNDDENKKSHDYCNVHSILDFHLAYAVKAHDHAITYSFLFSNIKAVLMQHLAAF